MLLPKTISCRRRAEQVGGGLARVVDDGVAAPAGSKDAVRVGVAPRHVVGHGADHRFVHLRAAGVVEEDPLPPVVALLQGGELEADGVYVEHWVAFLLVM
jgi:hypothetical protein